MAVLASDFVKRKKEHVFAEGYELDCATELTGGASATEEVVHVYGKDDPILDINVDNATLSLTVYDKKDNNRLLEALQRIDPDNNVNYVYKWDNVYQTTVWANRFNPANNAYTRSIIYKNWLPVPGMSAGDAAAKGTRTFAGNASVPKEYNHPILGEKLALTTGASGTTFTATLAKATPQLVPEQILEPGTSSTNLYAIRVMAINEGPRTANVLSHFDAEDLDITTTMVTSGGAITISAASGGDLKSLSWATHVYVNYLYNANAGVYPSVKPNGMFELIT